MARPDGEEVLALLKEGRRDEASRLLTAHLAAPSGWEFPPGDLADAVTTLERSFAAEAALRAGRIGELVRETGAAAAAVPASVPWLVFRVGSLFQASYRFTGRPDLREEALRTLGRVADRLEVPHLAVQARALMGNVHMMRGHLHRATEHCEAALALAAAAGVEATPAPAMAHQFRGYVLFEWNRLDEARDALGRAWDLTTARGVRSGVARVMAGLEAAGGGRVASDRWLARLEEIVSEPMTLRNREWLAAVRVRLALGTGDLRPVDEWLSRYDYRSATLAALEPAEVLARLHELDRVLSLLEATKQWRAVLDAAPVVLSATRDERRIFAARAAIARAVALEALGRPEEADGALDDALDLGREGSLVRTYIDGSRLREVLLRRAAGERDVEEARRVLEAAPAVSPEEPPTLTPRQLSVLERVSEGGSNQGVARELGVSVSTVKTHLRAIFSRLGVSSRTQAVARAREKGWL